MFRKYKIFSAIVPMEVCEDDKSQIEMKSEDETKVLDVSEKKKQIHVPPKKVVGGFSVANLISEDDEQKKEPSVGFSITSLVADCDTKIVNETEPPQMAGTPFIISNIISTKDVDTKDLEANKEGSLITSRLENENADFNQKGSEDLKTNLESSADTLAKKLQDDEPIIAEETPKLVDSLQTSNNDGIQSPAMEVAVEKSLDDEADQKGSVDLESSSFNLEKLQDDKKTFFAEETQQSEEPPVISNKDDIQTQAMEVAVEKSLDDEADQKGSEDLTKTLESPAVTLEKLQDDEPIFSEETPQPEEPLQTSNKDGIQIPVEKSLDEEATTNERSVKVSHSFVCV